MFSKILLKLIDQAIVPAILVVATRIISVMLISNYLNIEFLINTQGIVFQTTEEYLKVNSYSLLAVIVVLAIGMTLNMVGSTLFHYEHIKPEITAKLFSLKLHSLIKNSFQIYSRATIWISYLWLMLCVTGLMFYYQMVYALVFYTSVVITVIFTVILAMDIEKKSDVSKNSEFTFDLDAEYLEKGDK